MAPATELQQGRDVLEQAETLLQQAIQHVAGLVVREGKVSLSRLDQHQLVSFDLAWCAAETTAARALLDYIGELEEGEVSPEALDFETRLALVFTAQAVQNLRQRLWARPGEYGLTPGDFERRLAQPAFLDFLQHQLSSEALSQLGELVQERGSDSVDRLLNEEQRIMRDTFRRFADEVVAPLAEDIHRYDLDIPDEILRSLTEMGMFGLSIPERFGGLCSDEHEDNLGMILATEELSRGSLGAAGSLITRPEILSRSLLAGGTTEQQERWLPQLAAGEPLCAVAVTEPDYGSDVAGMKLRASKVDGGWQFNGAKTWCTFGGKAGLLLVLARTEEDPSLGHRGLSLFLLEKPSFEGDEFAYTQPEGGEISGRAIATIGYRGMHSFEIFFDNYFVPDEALLGEEEGRGRGFYSMMAGFAGGRIQTAARALGVMQAAFEQARTYAADRAIFGQPLALYPLTQAKMARLASLLAASRKLTYHVGRLMDQGKGKMEASLAKLFACRAAEEVTREAMQIHGGMGYAEETPVSRYFLDARVLSIFEGAEEILALRVIARGLFAQAASST